MDARFARSWSGLAVLALFASACASLVGISDITGADGGVDSGVVPNSTSGSSGLDGSHPLRGDEDGRGDGATASASSGTSGSSDGSTSSEAGSSSGGGSSSFTDGAATSPARLPTVSGTCPTYSAGMGGAATTVTFSGNGGGIQAQVWAGSPIGGGPLILYWHGTSGPSVEVPNALKTNLVTSAGGLIVAFNESSRTGSTSGNSGDGVWYQSDLVFADQAVACAIAQYHIDTTHIHVAGYDAGAIQAVYMWAARSAYVASVVSYSGGSTPNNGPASSDAAWEYSANVAPALVSHGAAGSDSVMGVDFANASIAWENMIKNAGGSWIDCNDGGDHTAFLGTRGPVLESDAVWFFQAHPYGIKTEPYKSLPAGWPMYCAVDGTGAPPVSPGG